MFSPRLFAIIALFVTFGQNLHAQRTETTLSDAWRFQLGDPAEAATPAFDDSTWEAVTVPHTWNHPSEPQAATKGVPRYHRGPGWYRRTLELTKPANGQRSFLRFEAASMIADVYLNGQKLGQHRGGYTAFTYEITDAIQSGRNLLAVRVDTTHCADVLPLSGDFTVFGGIYRPVHLIQTNALCINPLVHGGSGVSIRQSNVSTKQATITVKTEISNNRSEFKNFTLKTRILDADGKEITQVATSPEAAAVFAEQSLTLSQPHLWNGIADPYLYSVVIELIANEQVLDRITQPLGLRFFGFDKQQGFTLNGRPYRLRGVCRHQDFGTKGWAISKHDQQVDMALIREMGANAIRLAHYPHAEEFLKLCDRAGLIVWAEIPFVNQTSTVPEFRINAIQQLTEMIAQQSNHPSIATWGLWNELQGGPPALPFVTELHELSLKLDPTRPTTAASFKGSEKWCPDAAKVTNLLAINTYPGWYSGKPDDMGEILDNFRAFNPNQPLAVSEYGSGASIHHHQQGLVQGPKPRSWWHPEEWQALSHETHWRHIESRPFIYGSFIWNMFDFASAGRREGDMIGINDKGLVTHDRKVKKDAFFFYKASWSPEPVLHITSRRHALRSEAITSIKIYSNAENLTLSLNDEALPAGKRDGVIHTWENINLKQGENTVVATAVHQGKKLSDWVAWHLTPAAAGANR